MRKWFHSHRRPAPESGQQESGEPPAVPAPGQGAGSERGQEVVAGPGHQGCPGRRRGQRSRSTAWTSRASAARAARATWCCPATRSSSKATCCRGRTRAAARVRGPGEGDSEDAFRFVLSRDEFVDLFLDDLELPDLAKRKLAEVESEGIRRAGYATSGSPANISISRTVSRALARRVALRRPRPEEMAALEAELARLQRRGAPRRTDGRDRGPEGKDAAASRSSIRSTSATGGSRRCRSRWRRP